MACWVLKIKHFFMFYFMRKNQKKNSSKRSDLREERKDFCAVKMKKKPFESQKSETRKWVMIECKVPNYLKLPSM